MNLHGRHRSRRFPYCQDAAMDALPAGFAV
jgi:hypothetical protein